VDLTKTLDLTTVRAHPALIALHNGGVAQMVALIEKLLDAMFAPLARELERLPASAMRFYVFF
jgi:hypothetical protein